MKTTKYAMKTVKGEPVYTNGRGIYQATPDGGCTMRASSTDASGSEESRERSLRKAQKQLGTKCHWEVSGQEEYYLI